jgi:anti-sigma factor (TIGR02949 family)
LNDIPFDVTSCREAFRRIDDYLDGELTAAEMDAVRRHLDLCAVCADEFRVEEAVLDTIRAKVAAALAPRDLKLRVLFLLDRARAAGP